MAVHRIYVIEVWRRSLLEIPSYQNAFSRKRSKHGLCCIWVGHGLTPKTKYMWAKFAIKTSRLQGYKLAFVMRGS